MLAAILAKRPLASQHRHKALCIKPQGGCHWELGKDPLLNETCRAEEYSHNKVQKKSLSLQFRPHALLILLDTLEDRVQIHCYFCMTSECHVQILYVFLMDMLILLKASKISLGFYLFDLFCCQRFVFLLNCSSFFWTIRVLWAILRETIHHRNILSRHWRETESFHPCMIYGNMYHIFQ